MKANELRIGNLVFNKGELLSITPTWITYQDYWLSHKNENSLKPEDSLQPIPLTEEWLFKFGFDETKYGFVKMTEVGYLRIWDEDVTYCGSIIPNIKHVHTLQNLYFALTGEELKIKEI